MKKISIFSHLKIFYAVLILSSPSMAEDWAELESLKQDLAVSGQQMKNLLVARTWSEIIRHKIEEMVLPTSSLSLEPIRKRMA